VPLRAHVKEFNIEIFFLVLILKTQTIYRVKNEIKFTYHIEHIKRRY
jgi:hypothetical protein